MTKVTCLRVVGDEHDAVVGGGSQFRQHLVEHVELARELRQHGGGLGLGLELGLGMGLGLESGLQTWWPHTAQG